MNIELRQLGLSHPRRRTYGCPAESRLRRAFGGGGGTTTTKADIPPELAPMMTQTGQMVAQIQNLLAPLLPQGVQWMPQQIPGVDPYQQTLLDTLSGQIGSTGGSGLMPQQKQVSDALAQMYSPGGTFESNLLNSIGNTLGQDPISGQRMGPNSVYTDPGQLFAGISNVLGQNPISGAAVGPNAPYNSPANLFTSIGNVLGENLFTGAQVGGQSAAGLPAQGAPSRGYVAPSTGFTTGAGQSQAASLIASLLAALQGSAAPAGQAAPAMPAAGPSAAPAARAAAPAAQSAWQSLNPGYPASGISSGQVKSYIQYSGQPVDVIVSGLQSQGVNPAQVDAAMGWPPGTAARYAAGSQTAPSGSEQARTAPSGAEQARTAPSGAEQARTAPSGAEQATPQPRKAGADPAQDARTAAYLYGRGR
jgi:hypothetical protein